jgi:hypothetical protein
MAPLLVSEKLNAVPISGPKEGGPFGVTVSEIGAKVIGVAVSAVVGGAVAAGAVVGEAVSGFGIKERGAGVGATVDVRVGAIVDVRVGATGAGVGVTAAGVGLTAVGAIMPKQASMV